jgi:adenylate kinase
MQLILFGPPGIGKGTQSVLLAKRLELTHVSTGDLLRTARREGTELGKEAEAYMTSGRLVPDDLVRRMTEEHLDGLNATGYILDGYPRTAQQAEWHRQYTERAGFPTTAVLSLEGPEEVIIDRLSKRRINTATGASYHLDFFPPPADVDPALIIQRKDDEPDAIRKRLAVYHDETEPVQQYFDERGLLYRIDAVGEVEDVYRRITSVLSDVASSSVGA